MSAILIKICINKYLIHAIIKLTHLYGHSMKKENKSSFSLALITGASDGIGLELARTLAKQKINLILVGRNPERLQKAKEELQQQVEVSTIQAELLNAKERKLVIDKIRELVPDLVVNNAGVGFQGKTLSFTTEEQKQILQLNGNVLLEITLETARTWKSHGSEGVIMNVASLAGFQVMPYFGTYAASKTFVINISKALDEEWKSDGIRVFTACPGFVKTRFNVHATKGRIQGGELWMTMEPSLVAEEIWKQIQEGKQTRIIDWHFRVLHFLSLLSPPFLTKRILRLLMKPRRKVSQ